MHIVFAGTPDFAVPSLQHLINCDWLTVDAVLTQPDRPSGRGLRVQASPVKQLAERYQIDCLQPKTLRSAAVQARLAEIKPDLMVVVAYGLIVPKPVLTLPRFGCWNVHASLLPRYRGAAPIQAALLHGDKQTGVSLMQMDEGLDTGDVLCRREIAIQATDNATTLHQQLAALGAETLIDGLCGLRDHTPFIAEPQDESQATHQGKITKSQAQIDWLQSAKAIINQVRAYHGWPVAFAQLGDVRLRLWKAEQGPSLADTMPSGAIVAVGEHGLDVACGGGSDCLRVLQLQLPGGKCIPWQSLRGTQRVQFALGRQFD